jgi:hypothetical protein
MEQHPIDKQSRRSAAVSALLAAGTGAGIGWLVLLATRNNAVAIGMAGPIALVAHNVLRKVMR